MTPRTILVDHSRLRMAADGRLEPAAERAGFDLLRERVASGHLRFVASAFHLWEIGGYQDKASNEREAALIDSMNPAWIKTRFRLIEEELAAAYEKWRGKEPTPISPFVHSPGAYSLYSTSLIIVPGQDTASGFVKKIWSIPETRVTVMDALAPYVGNLARLTELQGQRPDDIKRTLENAPRIMAQKYSPHRDADGNLTTKADRDRFASEFDVKDSPTMRVEQAMVWAKTHREPGFKVSPSEAMDTMYSESALPHLDAVVLDRQFTELVRQARRYWPDIPGQCFPSVRKALEYLEKLPS